jgi:hypothetical protein
MDIVRTRLRNAAIRHLLQRRRDRVRRPRAVQGSPRRSSSTPANLGDLSAAILATVSVVHGELLGEPSDELRATWLRQRDPQLFTPYQSM